MHSITASLLTIILALALLPAPQNQQKAPQTEKAECGTTIPPEQVQAEMARQSNARTKARTKAEAMAALIPDQEGVLYLPLTIHMVCDRFGVGGFASPGELERALEVLNQLWRPLNIQFFVYGEIDFSIHDDSFYYLQDDEDKRAALRRINSVPNTINVYFTNLSGLAGQSSFTTRSTQGILLDYSAMSESFGGVFKLEVFAHEMGHFFDLYHTHEDDFGVECPSGSNCGTAGDLLCDTPADPKLNQGFVDPATCTYNNLAATPAGCSGVYNPPVRNLMSLSRGHCRNEFTPGQTDRVWNTLYSAPNRTNLIYSGKFFVDAQASNSNNNCTIDRPCRTVAKAVAAAQNGAIFFVKPGVHSVSTISGKNVTIRKWGDGGAVVFRP